VEKNQREPKEDKRRGGLPLDKPGEKNLESVAEIKIMSKKKKDWPREKKED